MKHGWKKQIGRAAQAPGKTAPQWRPAWLATAARLAGIFLLSAAVTAFGINHFRIAGERDRAAAIFAGQIPVEIMREGGPGESEMNVGGVRFDIHREIRQNSKEYVMRAISNDSAASGAKRVEVDPAKLRMPGRIAASSEFVCFVTKDEKIRGYLLNQQVDSTRVTSVEVPLKELKRLEKGRSRVDPSDVRPDFLQLMPCEPEFYLKNDKGSGMGIYSCRGTSSEADSLFSRTRMKFMSSGWKIEDWSLPAAELEDFPDKFIVASKGEAMCHVIFSDDGPDLHATYRFSGARTAVVGK